MTNQNPAEPGGRRLGRLGVATAFTVLVAAALAGGCQSKMDSSADSPAATGGEMKSADSSTDMVARGRYLVTISGCNDCHTPWKMGPNGPEPDMSQMLSGHPQGLQMPPPPETTMPWAWAGAATMTAFSGPWGITFSPNLTPDEETGIGSWDEELFVRTIRSGKIMGAGRPILPPMPWPNIAKMSDDDLKAVFAYLRSIPPIHNEVPDYTPPAGGGEGK